MDLRMYMGDITTLFDESSRKSVQVQFAFLYPGFLVHFWVDLI